jgi:LPXTG-motif cell wall-anchored protein
MQMGEQMGRQTMSNLRVFAVAARRAWLVAALAAALLLAGGSVASADPPGNNGTLKIHDAATGQEDRRNEPKVCDFYLVGFGFDANSTGSWRIQGHGGPNAGADSRSDDFEANADGFWRTGVMRLTDGMYKAFAKQNGTPGGEKQKVFKVDCPPPAGPGPAAAPRPAGPAAPPGAQPAAPGEEAVPAAGLPSTATAPSSSVAGLGALLGALGALVLRRHRRSS